MKGPPNWIDALLEEVGPFLTDGRGVPATLHVEARLDPLTAEDWGLTSEKDVPLWDLLIWPKVEALSIVPQTLVAKLGSDEWFAELLAK